MEEKWANIKRGSERELPNGEGGLHLHYRKKKEQEEKEGMVFYKPQPYSDGTFSLVFTA